MIEKFNQKINNIKFFIRADGSDTIGAGHIFRTLVLAKKLESLGNDVVYICRHLPGFPANRILNEGLRIISVPDTDIFEDERELVLRYIKEETPDWIIIDHYEVKENYYVALKETGVKVMAIDDINHTKFPVDILLNQNINGKMVNYNCNKDTVKLLGPEFALLRNIYRIKQKEARTRKSINNILIFMGGADSNNQTLKVLKGIELSHKKVNVDIVLGPAYRFKETIEKFIKDSLLDCKIYQDIPDLADLMLKADLAIGTGGSSCWEMCTLKLPMLLMPLAENQCNNAKGLEEKGAAINIGWWEDTTPEDIAKVLNEIDDTKIEKMSMKASLICKGNGVDKVIETLKSISSKVRNKTELSIRRATDEDCYDLWIWRNHPEVRKWCFNTNEIDFEVHKEWFRKKNKDENTRIYIIENEKGKKIGQVRFDINQQAKAVINVNLNPEYFGKGFGSKMIEKATKIFIEEKKDIKTIVAEINDLNIASKKAFERANYTFSHNIFKSGVNVAVFTFWGKNV